jgi:hypothetical protein
MTTQLSRHPLSRSLAIAALSLALIGLAACTEAGDDAVTPTPLPGSIHASALQKDTTTRIQFRYQGALDEALTLCLSIDGFAPIAMSRTPSKFTKNVNLQVPGDFAFHYFESTTADCSVVGDDVWPGPLETMVTALTNVPLATACAPRAGGGAQVELTINSFSSATYTGGSECPAPEIARVLIYAEDFVVAPTANQTVCVEVEGEGTTPLTEVSGRYRHYVDGVDYNTTRDFRFYVSGAPDCSTIARSVAPTDAVIAIAALPTSFCATPAAAPDEQWQRFAVDGLGNASNAGAETCAAFGAEEKGVANHNEGDTDVADEFGTAVAAFGDRVLVGADRSDRFNRYGGAAYVFRRDAAGWVEEAVLSTTSAVDWDRLGAAVALGEDVAAVGLWQRAPSGAVAVYSRTGTTWAETTLLTPPDGQTRDGFGERIALDGDVLVVGAYQADRGANAEQGAAYIYTNDGGWSHDTTLTRTGTPGPSDRFGYSVAVDGDVAVVSAPGEGTGTLYVYRNNAGTWSEEARLVGPEGVAVAALGSAVAVDGNRIAAGSIGGAGVVVFYEFNGTAWSPAGTAASATVVSGDRFGEALALEGDTLAVGAFRSSVSASRAGSAHVFTYDGTAWGGEQVFTQSDAGAGDRFGLAVDLHFGRLVVTGPRNDAAGTNSGSFYVYE